MAISFSLILSIPQSFIFFSTSLSFPRTKYTRPNTTENSATETPQLQSSRRRPGKRANGQIMRRQQQCVIGAL